MVNLRMFLSDGLMQLLGTISTQIFASLIIILCFDPRVCDISIVIFIV